MAIRTVRLGAEDERILRQLQRTTCEPVSAILRRGLRALQPRQPVRQHPRAFDIYKTLDLGPGGYARGASLEVEKRMKDAIRRKHGL
ncbi:MAG: hypothetical protein EPN33_07065 [Acidobacteria bacterium]|nr:MAG: hypothetical protein EPN33_07065 [Acidobacteriota bacterium]